MWSDLDIYAEGRSRADVEEYETLRQLEIDLVTPAASRNSPIGKQIDNTGVIVYG